MTMEQQRRKRPARRPVSRKASYERTSRSVARPSTPAADETDKEYTYEDYVKSLESMDKIIDVEDDDRLEKFATKTANASEKIAAGVKGASRTTKRLAKNAVKLVDLRLEARVKEAETVKKEGRVPQKKGQVHYTDPMKAARRPLNQGQTSEPKVQRVQRKASTVAASSTTLEEVREGLSQTGARRVFVASSAVFSLLVVAGIVFGQADGSSSVANDPDAVLGVSGGGDGDESGGSFVASADDIDFDILEPGSDSSGISEEGIFFDESLGVASYQGLVQNYKVTISQQPLTEEQKADPETFLSEISVGLFTQGSFETNKGTAHYTVPLPDVDPSQTVVFIHNNLLIFLRTQGVSLDTQVWQRYIDQLN